jgi:hypothetical protein
MSTFLIFPRYFDDYTGPRPPVIVAGPAPDDEAARFLAEDGLGTIFAGGDSIRCTAAELTLALRILHHLDLTPTFFGHTTTTEDQR